MASETDTGFPTEVVHHYLPPLVRMVPKAQGKVFTETFIGSNKLDSLSAIRKNKDLLLLTHI